MKEKLVAAPRFCNSLSRPSPLISSLFLRIEYISVTKSAVAMGGLLFGGMSDPLFRTLLEDDFARSYSVADLLNVDFLFRMFPFIFFNFPLYRVAICPRSLLPFLNFFSVGPLSLLIFENTRGRSTSVSFCFDGNYAFYRYGTGAGRVKTRCAGTPSRMSPLHCTAAST